jgi:hypothetical protein
VIVVEGKTDDGAVETEMVGVIDVEAETEAGGVEAMEVPSGELDGTAEEKADSDKKSRLWRC